MKYETKKNVLEAENDPDGSVQTHMVHLDPYGPISGYTFPYVWG